MPADPPPWLDEGAGSDIGSSAGLSPWRVLLEGAPSGAGVGIAPGIGGASTVGEVLPRISGRSAEPPTDLGLLFEVREQTPRSAHRWHGPVAQTASARTPPDAEVRLAVRPVMLGRTGKWVQGNLLWGNVGHQSHRLGLKHPQQRWFASFAALHRATRPLVAAVDGEWLALDDFHSPLLWTLLAQADGLGIGLVSSRSGTRVSLGARAEIGVDLAAVDRNTADRDAKREPGASEVAMRLASVLTIDGSRRSLERARPTADHGVYVYDFTPLLTVELAPTGTPLTEERRRLLTSTAVVIPANDTAEFFTTYLPRLRRMHPVSSVDGSIHLPDAVAPILTLTASFGVRHRLDVTWHWQDQVEPTPVLGPDAQTPDAVNSAQAAVERRVARIIDIEYLPNSMRFEGVAAAEFVAAQLPAIENDESVRVVIQGERPDYRELTGPPTLAVTTVETDHRDWLDLGVIVTVDGHDVPFGPLFTALATGRKKLLLVDRSYLSLDHPVFDHLIRLIHEATELSEWETGPRISRYQTALWADFEDLADESTPAASWRLAVQQLRDFGADSENGEGDRVSPSGRLTPLPAGLVAELRPYQRQGFEWLALLFRHRLGGILGDDMGLGKTLQALALIAHAVEQHPDSPPFLVVAPTSVVANWASEAARFTPGLAVTAISSTEKKSARSLSALAGPANVIVTSYALFRLDFDAYNAIEWAGLILDEAQFAKNPASKVHRCAVDLRAPVKIAITGTPMENSLMDIWALFAIVAPGLFPSARRFTERFVRPIAQRESTELADTTMARLRRRIRPLLLRRTKEVVATELPPKQEQVLEVELSTKHRAIYDTYLQRERHKLLGLLDDIDRNRFIIFRSLTLLRMLALDASLIDPTLTGVPSSKLEVLFEHLDDVISSGHRALVFSQFTSFLALAADRLTADGIAFSYLDGSTRDRPAVIAGFRAGVAPVFLISLKAGGFGLNLTEADYVFLLDPWWNPASENQAVDRTHRIGQTRSVNVYRLVATATIEEKVMALRERKARLFDAVMDDDGVFSDALSAADIRALLEA